MTEEIELAKEVCNSGPPENFEELWRRQGIFNKACGSDTIQIGKEVRRSGSNGYIILDAKTFDYVLAIISEVGELMNCVLWKHWSKEAAEGRRFEIHDQQNLKVELIDLLFFITSLAQVTGNYAVEMQFDTALSTPIGIRGGVSLGKAITLSCVTLLSCVTNDIFDVNHGVEIPANLHRVETSVKSMFHIWCALAINFIGDKSEIFNLYHQKYNTNVARQIRGRAQVGDELADSENRAIK